MAKEYYVDNESIGTESYHRLTLVKRCLATDGVALMCEKLKCFWFMDIVGSYIPDIEKAMNKDGNTFFVGVFDLDDNDSKGQFRIEDGDYNIYITQDVEYTDLKKSIKVFIAAQQEDEDSKLNWVVMLPSEY